MCPGGTKSCTEAGSSHTSSTSHARKTLLIPSSGSNYQRPVHRVFCYYPDRLLGVIAEMTLGPVRILGLIARTRLGENEAAKVGQMIRSRLAAPFDFLKEEFE